MHGGRVLPDLNAGGPVPDFIVGAANFQPAYHSYTAVAPLVTVRWVRACVDRGYLVQFDHPLLSPFRGGHLPEARGVRSEWV